MEMAWLKSVVSTLLISEKREVQVISRNKISIQILNYITVGNKNILRRSDAKITIYVRKCLIRREIKIHIHV